MSLKTWRASGVSADNAHGVIRPTGRSGCRRAPGPPESLAGLATAPGFSSPTPPARRRTSPQAEQAGIAQGAQFVEADAGEDFHAARIGAAQGLLQLAGTAGRGAGANGGSAALDGMQVAALLDIALAELAFELGEEVRMSGTKRRNTSTISSRLPPKRPTISPRASTSSPASAAVAGAPSGAAPAEMTEQAKHQVRLVDRLRHMVVHARRRAGFAVGQRGVGGHGQDRQPGEAPSARILRVASRPSISGICMSISTASNGTLASSTC